MIKEFPQIAVLNITLLWISYFPIFWKTSMTKMTPNLIFEPTNKYASNFAEVIRKVLLSTIIFHLDISHHRASTPDTEGNGKYFKEDKCCFPYVLA